MFRRLKKKKPMNFFVSIGAGINQIPLIKEAAKCGFQVIGVDQNSAAPGFYYCDLKIQESIDDYENIYIKLRELLVDGRISAVMTKSYGNAIITTSYLCEKFGLDHIPFDESKKFIDKRIMQKGYKEANIQIPGRASITARTNLEKIPSANFPIIVKPKTGHAKTDVRMLNKLSDLKNFLKNRKINEYIFEKIIEGEEIICCGTVIDGKYQNILISDKTTTPKPYFVDILHTTPSKHNDLLDEINEIGQKVTEQFGILNSPMIMEFIVREKQLYLLEAVPEFGGEFIPDIMVPQSTGYNLLENSINIFSNNKFKNPPRKLNHSAIAVKYIMANEGILKSFNTESARLSQGLIFLKIFKEIGSRVTVPKSNHDRIGVIICRGRTAEKAVESCKEVEEKLNIRIENGK